MTPARGLDVAGEDLEDVSTRDQVLGGCQHGEDLELPAMTWRKALRHVLEAGTDGRREGLLELALLLELEEKTSGLVDGRLRRLRRLVGDLDLELAGLDE